eukprot:749029-Hanusia_phi.AAC.3
MSLNPGEHVADVRCCDGADEPTWQEVTEPVASIAPVAGWTDRFDQSTGDVYYWNLKTGETTWDRPAELGPPGVAQSPAAVSPLLQEQAAAEHVEISSTWQEPCTAATEVKKTNHNALSALVHAGGYDSEEENQKQPPRAGASRSRLSIESEDSDVSKLEEKKAEKYGSEPTASTECGEKNQSVGVLANVSSSTEEEGKHAAGEGGGGGVGGDENKANTASASQHDADLDDFLAELDSGDKSSGPNADGKEETPRVREENEISKEEEGVEQRRCEENRAAGLDGEDGGGKEEQMVTSNMERACMEIVGLKKKGDTLIDRLKKVRGGAGREQEVSSSLQGGGWGMKEEAYCFKERDGG